MNNENDLTDEELEALEARSTYSEDRLDRLDILRKTMNASHLEKMFVLKKTSSLGPECGYYKKARKLFIEHHQQKMIIDMMREILKEFDDV
jgi:hypothetical protein